MPRPVGGYVSGYVTPSASAAIGAWSVRDATSPIQAATWPGTLHPEAVDWKSRVVTAGSTVSDSTLLAVSNFCRSIDSAGIRDRFFRLSLLCGNSLTAALVPLYRGPSQTGTQYGGTTDTNVNFVSGDWNETGSSCGLNSSGVNKYLNTGVPGNTMANTDAHLGVGLRRVGTSSGFRTAIGAFRSGNDATTARITHISTRRGSSQAAYNCVFGTYYTSSDSFGDPAFSAAISAGNIVASWPTMWRNGTASAGLATSCAGDVPTTAPYHVFAMIDGATTGSIGVVDYCDARIDWYSIGLKMTSAQVSLFNAAISAFQTALSRS